MMNTDDSSQITDGHIPDGISERRQYTRVQDAVGLHIQQLTDMPAAGVLKSPRQPEKVRKQDKYAIEGYAEVRRDYPEVASYIDALEERIRQLLLDGDVTIAKPTHKVSLSAGGIHFSDNLLLRPGDLIGLTLTLFPSGRKISTDARILDGNEAPEIAKRDEPSYRAIFVRLSEEDRLAIDNHVKRIIEKSLLIHS